MQTNAQLISSRIKQLRLLKHLKQSELDGEAKLPKSTISKIELGKREVNGNELVRISNALGVKVEQLLNDNGNFVYQEEIKILEALREIPFDDYQRLLRNLESSVYFAAKDVDDSHKEYMLDLVASLASMAKNDSRPRSKFSEKDLKRVRNKGWRENEIRNS